MTLSILIPTLRERLPLASNLLAVLATQSRAKSVQLLWLGDNFSMTTGAKRNKLMDIADGDYICFVDDDDEVSPDYIDTILNGIANNPGIDCLGIGGHHTSDGKPNGIYSFSPDNGKNHHERINGVKYMRYLPNHLCVWRRPIATRVKFPDKSLAEDHDFAASHALKRYTFVSLDGDIYHYKLDKKISIRYKK